MNLPTQQLPAKLAAEALRAWENILERSSESVAGQLCALLEEDPRAPELARLLACSAFAADLVRRKPGLLLELLGKMEPGALIVPADHRLTQDPRLFQRLQTAVNCPIMFVR